MRRVETGLNKILALRLSDEGLKFGSCESVDETRFGDDEKQHLSACEGRKFVCLQYMRRVSKGERVIKAREYDSGEQV